MTLENSKGYGLKERLQTLQDVSRNRLNGPTPHQATQRERASLALVPGGSARGPRRRARRWTDFLSPDRNMGVPQLMMLVEPNIVWDHVAGYAQRLGKNVEASYAAGEFFEGWHKAGRLAHGVYEGSYWELIGDCDEMIEMLKKMARAPPLLEEPTLNLPESPDLPKWEDFKPQLQPLPSAPQLPQLKLPAFRAPLLDSELPFLEPEYVVVPEVPAAAPEEPAPDFCTPQLAVQEAFVAPEYVQPEPPAGSEQPHPPAFGKPQHGHDWSGQRPFVVSEPSLMGPKLLDALAFQHPPKDLPKLPLMEDLALDRPDLDMNPIPKIELAWECGPEPEPSYASIPTPARASRPGSPLRSLAGSRPVSAGAGPAPALMLPQAAPPSAVPSYAAPTSRTASASPSTRRSSASGPPPVQEPAAEAPAPATWDEVVDVDGGKPRLWLNFEKPFAELPPLFLPPEPQLYDVNGPEPRPEDFPHDALEDEPALVMPEAEALPEWNPPAHKIPRWVPPCEPRPIGFLRGTAPVIILDVSGTMNPRMNGRFKDVKACVVELLQPEGELATAAGAFDVIAFCSGAWSWSATYASRMELLATSQTFYSGRQAGGKPRPGSSVAEKTRAGAKLQPTEPDMLADAANWVDKWPDAVGHTAMLAAFLSADEHWSADCWYVFSDGQADDPSQCIAFLEARKKHGQKVPVIHAVGFFPEGVPENFEGRRYLQLLAGLTGGSYQEYDRNMNRIFQEGVGFVRYNITTETADARVEREWAEAQVRAERKKNIALGIAERYEVTLARVAALHDKARVQVAEQQYEESIADMRAEHEARTDQVQASNAAMAERTRREHDAEVAGIRQRNQERLDAARAAFNAAHAEWRQIYDDALAEWRQQVEVLEAQRAEALAALNQQGRSRSRSPSRPGSARSRPLSAASRPASRPTSALRPPLPTQPAAAGSSSSPPLASSRPQSAASTRPASAASSRPVSARKGLLAAGSASGHRLPPTDEEPSSTPVATSRSHALPDAPQPYITDELGAGPAPESQAMPVSVSGSPAVQLDGDDEDAGIIQEEEDDEVGDLLPPLDAEDGEELKRQIFPREVVQALDDENEAALSEIRDEWRKLLKDTDARNKHKLAVIDRNKDVVDKYVNDVISAYAAGFVKDVLRGACLRAAANEMAMEAAQAAHERACAKIREQNAKTAAAHAAEVQDKLRKEEQYLQAVERWKERREELAKQYEVDIATARKNHVENVARAQQEWENRKEELEEVNKMRLKDAQERHERLLEDIRQLNTKHKQEHQERIKAKKAAEAENASRLAEARAAHKIRLELLQQENTARLASAQVEHQALCARLQDEHEVAKESAQQEYEELRAFLTQHNEALLADARAKYQEALVQAQSDFDELCAQLRQQHAVDLERVRRRNQEIWPQVQVARLAQAELGRVQAFAEHIKFCANKFALGVNFMPNTPNYDRVVEMQALTEALQRAFPDYPSDSYPWPDYERKGEPGTGWVASPQPPSLNLKDPAIEIYKLAMGKSRRGSSANSSRGPSSGAESPARSGSPTKLTPRGSVTTFLTAEPSDLPGGSGLQGPAMGLPPRPATATAGGATSGTAGGWQARPTSASGEPRRPEPTGLQGNNRRPQSARPQSLQASQADATTAAAKQVRRPESAGRMRFSNLVTPEGNGPGAGAASGWLNRSHSGTMVLDGLSPLAAAAATGGANRRPASARPQQGVVAPSQAKQGQQPRPLSANRPVSASRQQQQHLPARVAAKLNGMQSTLSAIRSTSGNTSSPTGRPPLAGFTRDLPRLQYAEIDVKQLD